MKKKILALLLVLAMLLVPLAACSTDSDSPDPGAGETDNGTQDTPAPEDDDQQADENGTQDEDVQGMDIAIGVLNGNTGVAAAWLMEQAEQGVTPDSYTFSMATAPDELAARLVSGEVQIAALATNVAANLYNKTEGGVQMAAISAYGVLYLLENGEQINSVADLAGKTIHTTGQGANPEYVLNYILEQNGLTPGVDVEIEFHPNEELSALMAAGEIEISMMLEPMVTTVLVKNEDVRVALDITEQWDAVSQDSSLVMTCVVVRTDFAQENPEAVARFLDMYSQSVSITNEDPAQAAEYIEKFAIIPSAAVAQKAIPGCSLTFIAGDEMQGVIEGYYEVLFAANPDAVGGAVPDADFYYVG